MSPQVPGSKENDIHDEDLCLRQLRRRSTAADCSLELPGMRPATDRPVQSQAPGYPGRPVAGPAAESGRADADSTTEPRSTLGSSCADCTGDSIASAACRARHTASCRTGSLSTSTRFSRPGSNARRAASAASAHGACTTTFLSARTPTARRDAHAVVTVTVHAAVTAHAGTLRFSDTGRNSAASGGCTGNGRWGFGRCSADSNTATGATSIGGVAGRPDAARPRGTQRSPIHAACRGRASRGRSGARNLVRGAHSGSPFGRNVGQGFGCEASR